MEKYKPSCDVGAEMLLKTPLRNVNKVIMLDICKEILHNQWVWSLQPTDIRRDTISICQAVVDPSSLPLGPFLCAVCYLFVKPGDRGNRRENRQKSINSWRAGISSETTPQEQSRITRNNASNQKTVMVKLFYGWFPLVWITCIQDKSRWPCRKSWSWLRNSQVPGQSTV